MKIPYRDLITTLRSIGEKYVTPDEADYFAVEVAEAYVRKYPRSNVLKDAVIADSKRLQKYKDNEMNIIMDLPSLLRVDCNHLPITHKIKWIHDTLEEKAKKCGVAFFAFDNSGGMHTLHLWTQGLAKRGLFAFGAYNGGPAGVVPANGIRGALGTNPITYGFPTNEGTTVVDMATAEAPFFEVSDAKKNGVPLRPNIAVDKNGNPTTDASAALDNEGVSNILPIGGSYRGFAINYLIEIMTGSLINAKLSDVQDMAYIDEDHGGFILAINLESFGSLEQFKSSTSRFNTFLRSQKSKDGSPIVIPGDKNMQKITTAEQTVDVDEAVWDQLQKLA